MNNIGVYLTEKQIRTLVRQELKTVLLEQSILLEIEQEEQESDGILNTIKKTAPLVLALISLSTAAGHSAIQPSSAGEKEGGGGPTIEDQLTSIGINSSKVAEMTNLAGLEPAEIKQLQSLLQSQVKAIKDGEAVEKDIIKIQQALEQNEYSEENLEKLQSLLKDKEKELKDSQIASSYYARQIQKREKLLQGFLNAGVMTTNYLMNNGNISDDLKIIQQDILKYGLEQSEGIALKTAEEDIDKFNKEYVKKDFYIGNSGISDPKALAMSWLVTHDKEFETYLTHHPKEKYTAIEIATALDKAVPEFEANVNNYFIPNGKALVNANAIAKQSGDAVTGLQALSSAADYQEKMNVGQEITPEQAKNMSDEDINKLPPEARQAVRDMRAGVKEAKINKLRQRINELRGVYV